MHLKIGVPKALNGAKLLSEARAQGRARSCLLLDRLPRRKMRMFYIRCVGEHGQEDEGGSAQKGFSFLRNHPAVALTCASDCIVMPCLPAHCGDEISDECVCSPQSVVFDEAENRPHIKKR